MSGLTVHHVACDAPGCMRVHPRPHRNLTEARAAAVPDGWAYGIWLSEKKWGVSSTADFCPEHADLAMASEPPHDRRKKPR